MYKYSHSSDKVKDLKVELFNVYKVEGDILESSYTIQVLSTNPKETLEALKFLVNCLEKQEEDSLARLNNMLAD